MKMFHGKFLKIQYGIEQFELFLSGTRTKKYIMVCKCTIPNCFAHEQTYENRLDTDIDVLQHRREGG